ncbi:MAG: HAMP domain-containing protein, partial [Deltaproteobacteria bacterium]|nr:HAMP domain-containing protein [Deltaproteobacteria bacterium]
MGSPLLKLNPSRLSLKAKFLVMMVSLCFLSAVSLFILYNRAERDLLEEVRQHTEEISTAIQVSIEQMSKSDKLETIRDLKDLTRRRKKGLKEISVVNNFREVIASSNPRLIGKKLHLKGESVKNIGNVTEYTTTTDGGKKYDILLPVIVGKERLGYIHLETEFDDFADIARKNHRNRLLATFAIFTIGILAAFYLADMYTSPIRDIAEAAHKVASGDLSVRLEGAGAGDEIDRLTENFNDMVKKLDENRALAARLKEAEHLSKIGALASGIAHEVRNPLNFINLSIDHIASVHAPEDPVRRAAFLSGISSIKSEIKRLDEMVSTFLNFGKPIKLSFNDVPLDSLINETASFLSESCAEQKISVEIKRPETPLSVAGDYKHIKTCLMNIFLNAMQSMPEGGKISVESRANNGVVAVMVDDTGEGIAPENLPRIFEPYFTTKEVGIGLGLALTKRIVEEHGGAIVVRSGF